jgi:hypothetical protein
MTVPAPNADESKAREIAARRRKRNIALALVLAVLVVIFYALTIVKMGPAVFNRAL